MTELTDKPRRGAPDGNQNRTLHGVRGWAAVGSFPKGCSHVRRYVGRMRVQLEDAVNALHGSISIYQAALIQSACRHEGRALLLTRWLRVEHNPTGKGARGSDVAPDASGSLSVTERLSLLKEIGNATDSRDKCIRGLGLVEAPDRNPWEALDERDVDKPADPGAPGAAWQQHADGMHETATSGQTTNTNGAAPNGQL